VTAATAPHTWFEFSHMKHCTVRPPYTKLVKWPTYFYLRIAAFWDVTLHYWVSGSWPSFRMSGTTCPVTQCHISEGHNSQLHCCYNLKSHMCFNFLCLFERCNEELNNLYCSHNIVQMIKLRRLRWVGHVACMQGKERCIHHLDGETWSEERTWKT
jgi:hypothetical protein